MPRDTGPAGEEVRRQYKYLRELIADTYRNTLDTGGDDWDKAYNRGKLRGLETAREILHELFPGLE